MAEPNNLFEKAANIVKDEAERIAQGMANYVGEPSDTKDLTIEDEIDLWDEVGIDPATGGPYNFNELVMNGMPPRQAIQLARPNRLKMIQYRRPNPKDQVEYAKRMKELASGRKSKKTKEEPIQSY